MSTLRQNLTFLILLFLFSCFPAFSQQSSGKSDKDKAGLVGPVEKIKIESAHLKLENGKWVESERHLWEESEFDRAGKLIKNNFNIIHGDPDICLAKYKYDDKGRKIEKFCEDGSKNKILEKFTYKEDRYGNWTKRITLISDGNAFRGQWVLYREITYFN